MDQQQSLMKECTYVRIVGVGFLLIVTMFVIEMKTKTLHQKIEEILLARFGEAFTHPEINRVVPELGKLIDEAVKEVVGEKEEPEEYVAKHLTEAELSIAAQAVKFQARNELRSEILKKWKEMNEG